MKKQPSEMSLEELWALFPVRLVLPKPEWRKNYQAAEQKLASLLSGFSIARISHIGSTAVGTILSKDIIDILIEFEKREDLFAGARALEKNGYTRMSADEKRISLTLGYTPNGYADKVYHIHCRMCADHDELYFRDYLIEHESAAREYEALKTGLAERFPNDRDAYTDEKTGFIKRCTMKAKALYGDRYRLP